MPLLAGGICVWKELLMAFKSIGFMISDADFGLYIKKSMNGIFVDILSQWLYARG
jgi:hypothetical protein